MKRAVARASPAARPLARALAAATLAWAGAGGAPAQPQELPEYRLKAAFVYNFAAYTEWPAEVGGTLNLCVFGDDPFKGEIEPLHGKAVGARTLALARRAGHDARDLRHCQIVFVAASAAAQLPKIAESLRGHAALIVADTPGAAHQGAALNMNLAQGRVSFEANLEAARAARLKFSSRLLRLATEVTP